MKQFILRFAVAAILLIVGFVAGVAIKTHDSQFKKSETANAPPQNSKPDESLDVSNVLRLLRASNVSAIYSLDLDQSNRVDDGDLVCVVREFEHHPDYEGENGVSLIVLNTKGEAIYEKQFTSIDDISLEHRNFDNTSQIALNVNYGGNSNTLEILSYQEGKLVEIFNELNGSGYELRPQFRSGASPALRPNQLLLKPHGLAGSLGDETKVYRYENGKYVFAGEYSQKQVDDFIEKLLTK